MTTITAVHLLRVGALLHLGIAGFHLAFPRLFAWPRDLGRVSSVNRGIVYVMNFALTYFFLLVGYLSWFSSAELLTTVLGARLLFAIALFWVLRAAVHPVYFRVRHPLSLALLVVFALCSTLYGALGWHAVSVPH